MTSYGEVMFLWRFLLRLMTVHEKLLNYCETWCAQWFLFLIVSPSRLGFGLCRWFKCYRPLRNCYINLNTHSPQRNTHTHINQHKHNCKKKKIDVDGCRKQRHESSSVHSSIKGKRARSKISNK